jgi:hypothetical protein
VTLPKFRPADRDPRPASPPELSDDSRAPVGAYLKLLHRKREERPLDGIVLTEHRQFDPARDYRGLEDQYGLLILTAAEVETDYGTSSSTA